MLSWLDDPVLLRVLGATERAAVAASALVGSGRRNDLDGVAVAALRSELSTVPIDGRIVVGEGEKDEAPMLHTGERVGTGSGPAVDIAVDPVDGTRLAAEDLPGAIAVLSLAPAGSLFDPGPVFYLDKLVAGAAGRGMSIDRSVGDNLAVLAAGLGRPVDTLRVAVQDRPRNAAVAAEVVGAGARLVAFRDGDVTHAVRAADPAGDLDLVLGIGGAPEGVLTAVAVEALGGVMQARRRPQTPGEIAGLRAVHGADALETVLARTLELRDLASSPGAFVLSAITGHGDLAPVRDARLVDSLIVAGGRIHRFTRSVD